MTAGRQTLVLQLLNDRPHISNADAIFLFHRAVQKQSTANEVYAARNTLTELEDQGIDRLADQRVASPRDTLQPVLDVVFGFCPLQRFKVGGGHQSLMDLLKLRAQDEIAQLRLSEEENLE